MADDPYKFAVSPLYTQNPFGEACHPNAPNGAGGQGYFVQAMPLGAEDYFNSRIPHPLSPAAVFLTPQRITKAAASTAFDIRDIPAIMTANGWTQGAALMNSWFKRPAHQLPKYDTPDTSTITMSWVLGFKRAKSVYDELVSERIWQNGPARQQFAKICKAKGLIKDGVKTSASFGDFKRAVPDMDAESVNFRTTGTSVFQIDDMDAALGRFVFKVLVKGSVSSNDGKKFSATITEVGVYIKDSYDFEGDQSLGYWDAKGKQASMYYLPSGTRVGNKDFQKWRTDHTMGGDFQVFSDLLVFKLDKPDSFETP